LSALQHEVTLTSFGGGNQLAASSQIMDADVAREAANLVSSQVQTQAGLSAVLALRGESVDLVNLIQAMMGGRTSTPSGIPGVAGG
jgi:flagellin-like hook-associated protein FlgL